jgi:uncharacterized membrane protein
MLLDHTRDFAHADVMQYDALDLSRTSPLLFLTRWITHLCAPAFVFLSGTSAFLQLARGKDRRRLSRHLLTRGLWLVVLEFVVVNRLMWFSVDPRFLGFAQVIWAIGISMIVMSALVFLPVWSVGVLGVAIIALHNLLDPIGVTPWAGPGSPMPPVWDRIWMALHEGGAVPIAEGSSTIVVFLYPLLPWFGVFAAGFAFGSLYRMEPGRRHRIQLRLGLGALAAFVALRATTFTDRPCDREAPPGYGDPLPWSTKVAVRQPPPLGGAAGPSCGERALPPAHVALSFVNTQKYPPSLLFLLMTLGPSLLLLRHVERTPRGAVGSRLATLGRVPFFFYLLQWIYAHGAAILLGVVAGQPVAWQFATPFERPFGEQAQGLGFGLTTVYATWAAGVILLYPLCAWYAAVKRRRRDWWLSYL